MSTARATLRRMVPLLGTYVEIGTQDVLPIEQLQAAFAAAYAVIQQVHARLSFQNPDSELSVLNARPGQWLAWSSASIRVLRLARAMTRASHGSFNCTVGGALVQRGWLPDHDGMPYLPVGTADDIEIAAGHVRLRRSIRLTLDGIAKGYAVDCAITALRRHGLSSMWVNAGGDLRVVGPCVLPVKDRNTGRTFGITNAALATSASGVQHDTSFPGAVLAAQSNAPVSGCWSVLAHSAWQADALTKVAALTPAIQRDAVLRRLGGRLLEVTTVADFPLPATQAVA